MLGIVGKFTGNLRRRRGALHPGRRDLPRPTAQATTCSACCITTSEASRTAAATSPTAEQRDPPRARAAHRRQRTGTPGHRRRSRAARGDPVRARPPRRGRARAAAHHRRHDRRRTDPITWRWRSPARRSARRCIAPAAWTRPTGPTATGLAARERIPGRRSSRARPDTGEPVGAVRTARRSRPGRGVRPARRGEPSRAPVTDDHPILRRGAGAARRTGRHQGVKRRAAGPRLLVPETVQTSGMDCGPAALRSLLAGFGARGELRPAARGLPDRRRRDVDQRAGGVGTGRSVSTSRSSCCPPTTSRSRARRRCRRSPSRGCPAACRTSSSAWRRHGRWVQLMDPATGPPARRRARRAGLPVHPRAAGTDGGMGGLRPRADVPGRAARTAAGAEPARGAGHGADRARARPPDRRRWRRSTRRRACWRAASGRAHRARRWSSRSSTIPPPRSPRCRPRPGSRARSDGGEEVLLRGAVLVRARGLADEPPDPAHALRRTSPPR